MRITAGRPRSTPGRRPRALAGTVIAALAVMTTAGAPAVAAPTGTTDAATTGGDGLANLRAVAPVLDCSAVTGLDLSGATDAAVTIESATVVTTDTPAPYCAVEGTIAPANTFVVHLPVQGWTQRYLQTGCGGLCGSAEINPGQAAGCEPVTDGTIATATTDMGHQGQSDGSWAAGNPQAQIDFAYRGVHATAQVAKALITRFYGRPPVFSYFTGCSDGGREALMEAQRYPEDFDGIAAGAPASNMAVQNTFHHAWNVLANQDENGEPVLLAGKLPLIHAAVVGRCDDLDGLVDGLLADPRRCDFDPATLVCATDQDPATCLSAEEADVVRRLHDGATTADGVRLEQAISHEWGSELDWTLFVPAAPGETTFSEQIALSYLRHLAHPNDPDPDYQLSDLELTEASFWEAVQSSTYMAALDPDLTRFEQNGGKLLLWHGWSDQHISPQATLQYYDTVRSTMGAEVTEDFAKLYLFPGLAHCSGGLGPDTFDVLTPVMAWVETRTAPGESIASKVQEDGTVTRTRPVYPYPAVARYDGSGSPDDAANFTSSTPAGEPAVGYEWLGQGLYSSGYQATCRVVDGQLVCDPRQLVLPPA
ncbi:tannase/feruloyl esterase family alpha/beta hydrolase [Kineococcus arenarius]|uniref:tannase/feruloyl esterase family alpha/beta hydrolase n=1 Tax=Kineococcus sp. SYSU DK007 TaxID=3383128 RepID=UPI003D7D7488